MFHKIMLNDSRQIIIENLEKVIEMEGVFSTVMSMNLIIFYDFAQIVILSHYICI